MSYNNGKSRLEHNNDWFRYFYMFSTLVFLAGVVYATISLAKSYQVTELNDILVSTDPVKAGTVQRYTARDCQNEGQMAIVTRTLILENDEEIPIDSAGPLERPVQCSNIILLPEPLPAGTYRVLIEATFAVNPVKDRLAPVKRVWRSAPFLVKNPTGSKIPPRDQVSDSGSIDQNNINNTNGTQNQAPSVDNTKKSPGQTSSPPKPQPDPAPEPNTWDQRGVRRCLVQALPGGQPGCEGDIIRP